MKLRKYLIRATVLFGICALALLPLSLLLESRHAEAAVADWQKGVSIYPR